jgi:hypothetical protein
MQTWWQLLQAWWADNDTDAGYPGSPGGQVPTLQSDGTVKWEAQTGGGELLVDDASVELLFDDASGDVLYDG